jgi:polyphosphate kinase 2 (PPK2 family)
VDLNQELPLELYEDRIRQQQEKMLDLAWKMFRKRRSCLLVFEGWDASGKGGTIRRVTQALDPRLYQVVGFSAPTQEEKNHHYLWRFWKNLPPPGLTAVFDRSHYGRVLVERVEGFATREEWTRGYDEINSFEQHLTDAGFIICKFWLHVSPEEQLKRFEARMSNPLKRHKINKEDWRNRDKWVAHEHAVEDMLALTSPANAPWTVVPANDKRFARVRVISTIVERLSKALD